MTVKRTRRGHRLFSVLDPIRTLRSLGWRGRRLLSLSSSQFDHPCRKPPLLKNGRPMSQNIGPQDLYCPVCGRESTVLHCAFASTSSCWVTPTLYRILATCIL